MNLERRKQSFVQLGKIFSELGKGEEWKDYSNGLAKTDYDQFVEIIDLAYLKNKWFTPENTRYALLGWGVALGKQKIDSWLSKYNLPEPVSKQSVAIIMAGNIPMVGLHDLICVLISGKKAIIKLSSSDDALLLGVIDLLNKIEPDWTSRISIQPRLMSGFDAVIATGSNNSARYFETYFGKYPHIIRKNRSSVAIIKGDEKKEQFEALGNDIFQYFGLGCRNVSRLFIPKEFKLDSFFEGIYSFQDVVNHNKYANNYDYQRAILMMNKDPFLENGFVIVREKEELSSPLSVIHYTRYENLNEVETYLKENEKEIQCVVGEGRIEFGNAQAPELWDYADKVDTLKFLEEF